MSYLLDTNVISELRKIGDGKADARVASWIEAEDAASFFISAITILELERGVLAIQRRDVAQGARLRAWLDNRVKPEFAHTVVRGAIPDTWWELPANTAMIFRPGEGSARAGGPPAPSPGTVRGGARRR